MSTEAPARPLSTGRIHSRVLLSQDHVELGRLQANGVLKNGLGDALKAEEPLTGP
jgi:hypothetical protein